MLTEKEIEQKLYEQAEIFRHYYMRKEYLEAELCREWAGMVALFIGWEEEKMTELFGTRQQDEPIDGLIREEYYIKAMDWCVTHGYNISSHTYQNVQKLI